MLTPTETITFAIGIVMCVIGVASFVVGMISRARGDGALSNKVDTALKGIDEIKQTLQEQRSWREDIGQKIVSHDEQIKTLFRRVGDVERDLHSALLIRRVQDEQG